MNTHPFNGPMSGITQVSQYHKGKTNLDFTEARDTEWQWHQLGHMQVCTSLQTDNHASTPPLSFLQAGCPSCRPTNSAKALKAKIMFINYEPTTIFSHVSFLGVGTKQASAMQTVQTLQFSATKYTQSSSIKGTHKSPEIYLPPNTRNLISPHHHQVYYKWK